MKHYLHCSSPFPLVQQHQTQLGVAFQVKKLQIHKQKWWLSAMHLVLQEISRLYKA